MSMPRGMKLDSYLSFYTKTNYKYIQDTYVKSESLRLQKENISGIHQNTDIEKNFLTRTWFVQEFGPIIVQWNLTKLKSVCTKEIVNQVRRKPKEWKRIFSSWTSDRRLIPLIYKESERQITYSKMATTVNRKFSKIRNTVQKECSSFLSVLEKQSKQFWGFILPYSEREDQKNW